MKVAKGREETVGGCKLGAKLDTLVLVETPHPILLY